MQKSLQELKEQKSQQNETGGMVLSADFTRLLYESPLVSGLMDGDMPYSHKVEPQLQETCQQLSLDYAAMSKELQQALNADYLLYDDCSPWAMVQTFLEGRKLGPAGNDLYEAIKLNHTLSKAQEELLEKICLKIGHEDWPAAILQEIAQTQHLYDKCMESCSAPGRLPVQPLPFEGKEEEDI